MMMRLFGWLIVAIALSGPNNLCTASEIDTLVVLHTNDFHGYISPDGDRTAGLARIAAYFNHERARGANVLAIDGGDCVSGTPVSILFKGRPIFEAMSVAGYDAAVLGNHEFDYGWREILAYRDLANFPLLSVNARSADGKLIADAPSVMLERSGLRIGIVGVTTQRTNGMITTVGNEGISFDAEVASVGTEVASIRDKVDVLILLSHAGHKADSLLAESVDGIDLIVSGHSHSILEQPQFVRSTPIVRAGAYSSHVGHVMLQFDRNTKRILSIDGFVVPAAELPEPDSKVAVVVSKWEDRVSEQVDVTIGHTNRTWSIDEMYLLVEHILKTQSGADLVYYNKGGIRNLLHEGDITARHIWNIHPFGNRLVTFRILGKNVGGAFAKRLELLGVQIDLDQYYIVATNTFVVESARRQTHVGIAESVDVTDILIRDTVIDYIKAGKALDTVLLPARIEEEAAD
jgi:2',3'-cyclic-nucleotide 2'-phosphodiesterase (5'-nucleotidase family)